MDNKTFSRDHENDLISRQAAIDMCRKPRMRNADCSDFEMEIMMLPSAQPEPCEDAVSRLEIVRNLHKYFKEGFEQDKWWNSGHVIHAIMDAPSVTPKQRTGKWIHVSEEMWKCDQCGEISCCSPKYCPDCGSMNEVTE